MNGDVVSIKNVMFQRDGKKILTDIDWEIFSGDHWVILGLNGSGKTSLLKIIAGYQWPTKGEVSVLGNTFGKTNIPELRKSLGWVSVSFDERLLTRTRDSALEMVLSGKHASVGIYEEITEEDVDRGMALLKQLNIQELADELFVHLSQGEKRRVVIARALMPSPKILILDEPCNGLDVYSKEQLLTTIQTLATLEDGPTLLYVTHQLEEVIPAISHVLLMNSGSVLAAGEKQTILSEPLLEKAFQVPLTINWQDERPWLQIKRNSVSRNSVSGTNSN